MWIGWVLRLSRVPCTQQHPAVHSSYQLRVAFSYLTCLITKALGLRPECSDATLCEVSLCRVDSISACDMT